MFKRILVPLDGSHRAERAIAVAARLARASGGSVVLLRVVNAAIEFWIWQRWLLYRREGKSRVAPCGHPASDVAE